jgi:hypothetical protein
MKNYFFIFFAFLFSCKSDLKSSNSKTNQNTKLDSITKDLKEKKSNTSFQNFLEISKNVKEIELGFFQGVEKSEASGPFVFKDYFSDSLNFRIVFYPKNHDKYSVNFKKIGEAGINNYKDFICFVFVYSKQKSLNMKDYHEDKISYPVSINSYIRKEINWQFINKGVAQNLSDLSKYEIKIINLYAK